LGATNAEEEKRSLDTILSLLPNAFVPNETTYINHNKKYDEIDNNIKTISDDIEMYKLKLIQHAINSVQKNTDRKESDKKKLDKLEIIINKRIISATEEQKRVYEVYKQKRIEIDALEATQHNGT
jgi:superfamily I DNA and/or RNA helicase